MMSPQNPLDTESPIQVPAIIAVFVTRSDHQHAEANDLVDLVGGLFRHTRVGDAARHASGDAKPL
jgi:hypothetical protein